MKIDDPRNLRFGPYTPPACELGDSLTCHVRGRVDVVGQTRARIPWPYVGAKALIVCGDLARAVRMEATAAVAFHWGVSQPTVSKWRRALGVGRFNVGSTAVRREVASRSHAPHRMSGAARVVQPWTAADDALLILPPAEAARRLGRSVNAVHGRLHRLRKASPAVAGLVS
jgi:hypothetical protein